jgi:hypothetical protein
VLTGWLQLTLSIAVRSGSTFAAPRPITAADRSEKAWDAGVGDDGDAIVLTLRKHKPTQRVRATFVAAGGTRSGPAGEAAAAWITNTDGSGSGQVAAALHPAG